VFQEAKTPAPKAPMGLKKPVRLAGMNVQKTMEFILEQQAAMIARQAEHEARLAGHGKQMAEHDKRMAKIDKRIDAITKLIQTGMRILAKTDEKLNALVDAQMRAEARMEKFEARMEKFEVKYEQRPAETDARLDRLIKALARGTNGHSKN
jgi:cell pole-organizing protein PopZ